MSSSIDAQPVAAAPRRDPEAGDGWLTLPPAASRPAPESGIDSLLLRVGAAVRAAQAGAAVYEERGQRLRARRARRAAIRTARAIVREALSVTAGGLPARLSEPEQLELDLAAEAVQTVEPPAEPAETIPPAEPEALEGDTVEVPVVVPDAGSGPSIPRLPSPQRDGDEGRTTRLPAPEPVGVVATVRLPRPEPGVEDGEPEPAAEAAPPEAETALLDRISAYTRIPAAAG